MVGYAYKISCLYGTGYLSNGNWLQITTGRFLSGYTNLLTRVYALMGGSTTALFKIVSLTGADRALVNMVISQGVF